MRAVLIGRRMRVIGEFMTKEEIYAEFDAEWVVLEDTVRDETHELKGGIIIAHGKNKREVYGKAVELRPKHSAFLYTGEIPEGTVVVIGPIVVLNDGARQDAALD